jgi:hypothetical protein
MSSQKIEPDHLFVSHASEDYAFSDWLSLKLAAEGYNVWYDRIKLLGGESYPHDIDDAIKNQSFRFLSLLSKNSINKPDPVKERTLAIRIGNERKIDFVIPLNVDGLKSHELPWMASDLTFISFHRGWHTGFVNLLKKLDSIHAPKNEVSGKKRVVQWLSNEESISPKPEQLWTNIFPVIEIPRYIHQYVIPPELDVDLLMNEWPIYVQNPVLVWSFTDAPTRTSRPIVRTNSVDWVKEDRIEGMSVANMISFLIKRSIEVECLAKGLRFSADRRHLHFPQGSLPKDRLYFKRYDGRRTFVNAVGKKTFHIINQGQRSTEVSTYSLAPSFRPVMERFDSPVVKVLLGIHWVDAQGNEITRSRADRRRKALCKSWWNYEWLARLNAVMSWLASGNQSITLCKTESGNLVIAGVPVRLSSSVSISEEVLKPRVEIAEEVIEDDEEEEPDDQEEVLQP